MQKSMASTIR